MTVRPVTDTRDRAVVSDHKSLPEIVVDAGITGRESAGASSEESPKSAMAAAKRGDFDKSTSAAGGVLHSQVLRIREEDSHLGEDIFGEGGLNGKDHSNGGGYGRSLGLRRVASAVDVMLLSAAASRPILPCSPLSGKSAVRAAFH